MPIDTSGGNVNIKGGYNDVARDMHSYHDNSRHTNSHNVKSSKIKGSFNDSSINKNSSNSRVVQTTPPTKHKSPQRRKGRVHCREGEGEAVEDDSARHSECRARQPAAEDDDMILIAAYRILAERERAEKAAAEGPHSLNNPFDQFSQHASPSFSRSSPNPFVSPDSTYAHTRKDNPRNPFMRR